MNDISSIDALKEFDELHSQFIDIEENKIYGYIYNYYYDILRPIARFRIVLIALMKETEIPIFSSIKSNYLRKVFQFQNMN